jgi:hypothetical protein
MIQTFSIGLAALGLATVSPRLLAAPPHTGIEGRAFVYMTYGPATQIEDGTGVGIPSVQFPIATSFTILSAQSERVIASVATDANGYFLVSVPPGKYLLVPATVTLNPFLSCDASTPPIEITVQAKAYSTANIFYFREGPCTVIADSE